MIKKFIAASIGALATLFLMTPAAVDARTLDEIIKSGVIKVAVHPNLPPLSSINPSQEWEGFDIDIGNLLAEKLGVKAEFVPTETPARVPNIVAGIVDISLGGLTRNSRRMKVIDYTVPLHTENMAVLLTEKVKGVEKWQDLNRDDITLVECRGCTPAKFVEDNLPNAKMILVEGAADMVRTVAQGRADGLIANLDFYPVLLRNHPNVNWVILPNVIRTAYNGIGLEKGNHGLRTWLNQALWELQTQGLHVQLWEKHYGMPPIVPVVPQPYF